MKLYDKFAEYIERKQLIDKNDKLLLAVSGGVDSMTMFDLVYSAGYKNIAVAHCNFQLRGENSMRDEELVTRICEDRGVKLHSVRFDTHSEASGSNESIQMVARRLRYRWFDELCCEHGYTKLVVAHHADDSAETFFINLIRGTGLRGLTGISIVARNIIRPLLFARRDDIVGYAAEHNVEYRDDESNSSLKYLRNRVRWDIIPRLIGTSAAFPSTMAENIERLEQTQCFVDDRMGRIRAEALTEKDDRWIIDLDKCKDITPFGFVIYSLLREFGFSGEITEDIERGVSLSATGRQYLSSSYRATLDRNTIIVTPRTKEAFEEETFYRSSRHLDIEYLPREVLTTLAAPAGTAFIDADTLTMPLTLRRWREGDWFIPLGMSGQKKVSDFFIDTKVSLPDKERGLVLVSEGQIVWLVGRRIDDRFKVTDNTRRVAVFTIKE